MQKIGNSQNNVGKKYKVEGLTLPDFKAHYIISEGTDILDQWNKIKSPKVDAYIHD